MNNFKEDKFFEFIEDNEYIFNELNELGRLLDCANIPTNKRNIVINPLFVQNIEKAPKDLSILGFNIKFDENILNKYEVSY